MNVNEGRGLKKKKVVLYDSCTILKRIVHSEMTSNLYDFYSSVEHKGRCVWSKTTLTFIVWKKKQTLSNMSFYVP